jgi:hypothetical protein
VVLTAIDDGMIRIVLFGRLCQFHIPLVVDVMDKFYYPRSIDANKERRCLKASVKPYIPSLKGLGFTGRRMLRLDNRGV